MAHWTNLLIALIFLGQTILIVVLAIALVWDRKTRLSQRTLEVVRELATDEMTRLVAVRELSRRLPQPDSPPEPPSEPEPEPEGDVRIRSTLI